MRRGNASCRIDRLVVRFPPCRGGRTSGFDKSRVLFKGTEEGESSRPAQSCASIRNRERGDHQAVGPEKPQFTTQAIVNAARRAKHTVEEGADDL